MIMETAGLRVQETAALGPPAGVVTGANDFQQLYERHWEAVFAVAYRVTGNASDAEDVLQSVFLRLMGNRTVIDGARSPEGYLRRSAANASIDILRRRRSRSETELNEQSPARESSPVDKERVRNALARLEPASAEMFVLCYLEGYTYEELAEMFETERGTIASRLYRIRAELRDYLSK